MLKSNVKGSLEKGTESSFKANGFKNRYFLFFSRHALFFIVLAGFLVRVAALQQAGDIRPVLDERLYLQRAHGLLDGLGHLGSFQSWVRHPQLGSEFHMSALPQYPGAYQPPLWVSREEACSFDRDYDRF